MKAVECLNESLGASEVDGTFPMPPFYYSGLGAFQS